MSSTEVEIVDNSAKGVVRHTLYVNGDPKAHVVVTNGEVRLHWAVYGPQSWEPEGRALLQGLVELSVIADQLAAKQRKFSREEVAE